MANKIVLISDDSNFFDFIKTKLELRKSDELFTYSFDSVLDKLYLLSSALFIIDSENSKEKTLDLLNILKGIPSIVCAYNDDEVFRRKCYRAGMFDFITLLVSDSDFRARILPALSVCSLLEKNNHYRNILVKNNFLNKNNEVYINFDSVIDEELAIINQTKKKAVFVAIAPSDKSKFLIKTQVLESVILNNIRKNDILMNYAPNKYFLFVYDADITAVKKIWEKILIQFPQKLYAGFVNISNQKRQQLINEALNKLHEAINQEKDILLNSENIENASMMTSNFKMFRKNFSRKIEQIVVPVFYQIQQKYSEKIMNVVLEQSLGDNFGAFYIKGARSVSSFKITCPGFSKINIDIIYTIDSKIVDSKRISLEPDELEAGLLSDLLEQFILEYRQGDKNNA